MLLLAGQRISLIDTDKFFLVESGKVEIYAVSGDAESFRQSYLIPVERGEAIFSSMDDLTEIKISVYAVEDAELLVNVIVAELAERLPVPLT